MLKRGLRLLVGASLVAAACSNVDDVIESEPTTSEVVATVPPTTPPPTSPPVPNPGGTLVWVHDEEPVDLHVDDPANQQSIAAWIRRPLLEGLYGVDVNSEFYPSLLAEEASITVNDDGSVSFDLVLRNGLRWSNGDALTAHDIAYTWKILSEGCRLDDDGTIGDGSGCVYRKGQRLGYELISDLRVVSDTKFSFTLVEFFAGWKTMFAEIYHPSFGETAAQVNQNLAQWSNEDGALVSSGPMVFESWEAGERLSLIRNQNYHGSRSPDIENPGPAFVDGVAVLFVEDAAAEIAVLQARDAQVVVASPLDGFAETLGDAPDFVVKPVSGSSFEHWGFNLLNPHLAKPEVREALAYALDKHEIVASLYGPLFGSAAGERDLGNTYWMAHEGAYEDHQEMYSGAKLDEAAAALESVDYVRIGAGIYSHPVDGVLSLRVGTTSGDASRELQQKRFVQQMREAGIEIVVGNLPRDEYFSQGPFSEEALLASTTGGEEGDARVWDIAQFAWLGGLWPGQQSGAYLSGSSGNPYGFASEEFDAKAEACEAAVDEGERAGCYNELDQFVSTLSEEGEGLFMLPLTQTPTFFGYLSSQLVQVGQVSADPSVGPLANVVDFRFRS